LIDKHYWKTRDDLAKAYLNRGASASDGVETHDAIANHLGQLSAVLQNQDNRKHDPLDSDAERPKVRTLKEELNQLVRSRLLTPK